MNADHAAGLLRDDLEANRDARLRLLRHNLVSLARRRFGWCDPEDLVQDAFLAAIVRRARVREARIQVGFLVRVMRNRAVDHLRRSRREVRLEEV